MADPTIVQDLLTTVLKWAVAIIATAVMLTTGAAALGLGGGTALAVNTWPAPIAEEDPDNTWPAA